MIGTKKSESPYKKWLADKEEQQIFVTKKQPMYNFTKKVLVAENQVKKLPVDYETVKARNK